MYIWTWRGVKFDDKRCHSLPFGEDGSQEAELVFLSRYSTHLNLCCKIFVSSELIHERKGRGLSWPLHLDYSTHNGHSSGMEDLGASTGKTAFLVSLIAPRRWIQLGGLASHFRYGVGLRNIILMRVFSLRTLSWPWCDACHAPRKSVPRRISLLVSNSVAC